jgi:hypothetical protein
MFDCVQNPVIGLAGIVDGVIKLTREAQYRKGQCLWESSNLLYMKSEPIPNQPIGPRGLYFFHQPIFIQRRTGVPSPAPPSSSRLVRCHCISAGEPPAVASILAPPGPALPSASAPARCARGRLGPRSAATLLVVRGGPG